MNTLLYFIVMAAAMLGLSKLMPGFQVKGWTAALFGAVVLALVNAVLKPILFVITLPLTILTLGLFLLIINAITLWVTAKLVPGFTIQGFGTHVLAAFLLACVGIAWKAITPSS